MIINELFQSGNIKIAGESYLRGTILKEPNRSYKDFAVYLVDNYTPSILLTKRIDGDGTFTIYNLNAQVDYTLLAKDRKYQFNDIVYTNVQPIPYQLTLENNLQISEDSTRVNGSIKINNGLGPFTLSQISGSIPDEFVYAIDDGEGGGPEIIIQGSGNISQSYESWIKITSANGYSKVIPVYIDPFGTTGNIKNFTGEQLKCNFQNSRNNILASAPVAYWNFNDAAGSTSIADYGSGGNPLVITGSSVALQTNGYYSETGQSVFLNGSAGYLKPASSTTFQYLGDISVFACFSLNRIPTGSQYISLMDCYASGETEAVNATLNIEIFPAFLKVFHENGAGVDTNIQIAYQWQAGVPYQIFICRDTTLLRYAVYINGDFLGYYSYINNPTGGTTSTLAVGFTPVSDTNANNALITIDELAYWQRYLSQEDIQNMVAFNESNVDWSGTTIKSRLRFDDDVVGSSSITDDYSNTWTVNGVGFATVSADGYKGNCLYFPGGIAGNVLSSTPWTSIGTQDWCIQFFMKMSQTTQTSRTIIDFRPTNSNGSYPWIGFDNSNNFAFYYQSAYQITTPNPADDKWHHIACTKNKGVIRLFLDGNLVGAYFNSSTCPDSSTVRLGVSSTGAGNTLASAFLGYVDEIRVDVGNAIYTKNFTPSLPYGAEI